MWELDCKEGWASKSWSFWIVVLEKTFVRPLDCKEVKPVNPKWSQSWISIGGTDAEGEVQHFGHLMRRAGSLGKLWCWETLREEEKRVTEDEMVRWHHWLNGNQFEQTPGDCGGQRSLACCGPWDHRESDMT